jgi:hypothetical protein
MARRHTPHPQGFCRLGVQACYPHGGQLLRPCLSGVVPPRKSPHGRFGAVIMEFDGFKVGPTLAAQSPSFHVSSEHECKMLAASKSIAVRGDDAPSAPRRVVIGCMSGSEPCFMSCCVPQDRVESIASRLAWTAWRRTLSSTPMEVYLEKMQWSGGACLDAGESGPTRDESQSCRQSFRTALLCTYDYHLQAIGYVVPDDWI